MQPHGMVLGFRGAEELEHFYTTQGQNTLKAGLAPAFEAQPRSITAVDPVAVTGRPGLFLLAGDLRLSKIYEVTLGIAQELSAAIGALQNLPGSLAFLLEATAEAVDADFVLIDMSPGLGPIDQNLVAISDYLIVPSAPDFFSVMAIDSLARVLPRWRAWAEQTSQPTADPSGCRLPFPGATAPNAGHGRPEVPTTGGPARELISAVDRPGGRRREYAPASSGRSQPRTCSFRRSNTTLPG